MSQNNLISLPCLTAGKHIPCEISYRVEKDKYGRIKHRYAGCQVHHRTKQQNRREYCTYGIQFHCYCGLDLKCSWNPRIRDYEFSVFEKTFCTPAAHYQQYIQCPANFKSESKMCGWHGLKYPHCRLCKEPLLGEPLGKVNGKWVYSPFSLAKRIWRTLTASVT